MTKHQQVHIEFRGPLQDSAGDIVLRCTHDLAVRIDACGGQPVCTENSNTGDGRDEP